MELSSWSWRTTGNSLHWLVDCVYSYNMPNRKTADHAISSQWVSIATKKSSSCSSNLHHLLDIYHTHSYQPRFTIFRIPMLWLMLLQQDWMSLVHDAFISSCQHLNREGRQGTTRCLKTWTFHVIWKASCKHFWTSGSGRDVRPCFLITTLFFIK